MCVVSVCVCVSRIAFAFCFCLLCSVTFPPRLNPFLTALLDTVTPMEPSASYEPSHGEPTRDTRLKGHTLLDPSGTCFMLDSPTRGEFARAIPHRTHTCPLTYTLSLTHIRSRAHTPSLTPFPFLFLHSFLIRSCHQRKAALAIRPPQAHRQLRSRLCNNRSRVLCRCARVSVFPPVLSACTWNFLTHLTPLTHSSSSI